MTGGTDERPEDLDERVATLEESVAFIESELEHHDAHGTDHSKDLADIVESQAATIADLRDRVASLEARIEATYGTDDGADGTPEQRTRDLREAMIRRAAVRDDAVTWWWKDVREELCMLGYRELSKPVYFDDMERAADAEGFAMTEKPHPDAERSETVKAIGLNPDALPADTLSSVATTQTAQNEASEPTDVTGETSPMEH